MSNAMKFQNTK